MVICAPCQPFSSQNRKRQDDIRARLLISAARFVSVMEPEVVFVENVPGLASRENAGLLAEFRDTCGAAYVFGEPTCVDAADYGVPQRRVRCLLMASRRREAPQIPPPTTPTYARRTVRDAISSLPSLASGERRIPGIRFMLPGHTAPSRSNACGRFREMVAAVRTCRIVWF